MGLVSGVRCHAWCGALVRVDVGVMVGDASRGRHGMGGDCSWLRFDAMGHELVCSSLTEFLRPLTEACTHTHTDRDRGSYE